MGIGSRFVSIFPRWKTKKAASAVGKPTGKIAAPILAELIRPECKDVKQLADQMKCDPTVKLARQGIMATLQSAQVTVSCEGDDPRAKALSDHLQTLWDQTLSSMMDAYDYGRVAYEKVYEWDATNGLMNFKCLDALDYDKTEMVLGPDGSFEGIDVTNDKVTRRIPADKSLWIALNATVTEPHGKSEYLGAQQAVWRKKVETDRRLDKFVRRLQIRGGVAYHPGEVVTEQGLRYDGGEVLQAALCDQDSGGYLLLPNERDENGNYLYQFTEKAEILDTAPLLAVVTQQETEQIRAAGVPEKTLTEGAAVGSYSSLTLQMLVLYSVVDGLLMQFASQYQKYVIDKSVDLNFPADAKPKIEISFTRLAQRPDSTLQKVVESLFSSPLNELALSGAVDIQQMLENIGIPVSHDVAQKLAAFVQQDRAMKAQVAQAQAARLQGPPAPPSVPPIPGGQASMAMGYPQRGPTDFPEDIPTEEELLDLLRSKWEELHQLFIEQCLSKEWDAATKTLKSLRELQALGMTGAKIVGAITPWKPRLQHVPSRPDAPLKHVTDLAATISPTAHDFLRPDKGWHFPWLETAAKWLLNKRVLPASSLVALEESDRSAVFSAHGIDDTSALNVLKQSLAGSLVSGEALPTARQSAEDALHKTLIDTGLADYQFETLFRTSTHQAFMGGFRNTIENPVVKTEFPYVMLVDTHDDRTRETHQPWPVGLGGVVTLVGSYEYQIVQRALNDWNCRCASVSLNLEDAQATGMIKKANEFSPEVLKQYG